MQDSRLLGTWKSDARRTLKELRLRRDMTAKRLAWFRKAFGKLELRFTRERMYSELRGSREWVRYRVAAKDDDSVAVVYTDPTTGEEHISHMNFRKDHYWIALEGGIREFFKRVPAD